MNIRFKDNSDTVRALVEKLYYFDIPREKLESIGHFTINKGVIDFADASETKVNNKINKIITHGFSNLTSLLTGRQAVYIHDGPLIGCQYFGLVDRNTNLIELRPLTGCNLDCIYCSINEGGNKKVDYYVDKDHLVSEFRKLAEYKACDVEAHINPQGEPLLYPHIVELIKDLSQIPVKRISMDTNGVMLGTSLAKDLINAGLTQANISLNALNPDIASRLAGRPYNVQKVLDAIQYMNKKIDLIVAPVMVPGINEEEVIEIIKFCKKHKIKLGIQNFMAHKHGKIPTKALNMDDFYKKLKTWQEEFSVKLIMDADDFSITKTNKISIPFKKNEIVHAQIMYPGRQFNEMIASAKERLIHVRNCVKNSGYVKTKILRTKHNIFLGKI